MADMAASAGADVEAVTVRTLAVPLDLLPAAGRGPCEGCDFRPPAPRCEVLRARAVALGLPDCSGGYVYREVRWEPV